MREILIPLVVMSSLLTGCVGYRAAESRITDGRAPNCHPGRDPGEAGYYWGNATYLTFNRGPSDTPEFWSRQANDKSRTRQQRSMAAALLFGSYVRPSFTTEHMRTALPDLRWLKESQLKSWEGGIGGRWPFLVGGSHFYLLLFPDPKDFRGWRIDFTLSGGDWNHHMSVDDARAFLAGTLADKRVRIEEFIMTYPLPGSPYGEIEEMHNPRGVGIKILPGSWYD